MINLQIVVLLGLATLLTIAILSAACAMDRRRPLKAPAPPTV
jgi:hypothetical protein